MTRRTILAILALAILTLTPAAAQAYLFPSYGITDIETYLDGQGGYDAADYSAYSGLLSGLYTVTALATEAEHTDYFFSAPGTSALFNNQDVNTFGTSATDVDLNLAYYYDATSHNTYTLDNSAAVSFYQLNSDWNVPELGITLTAGTLIFGLNDSATVDGDYDDLILAAVSTNATPIPGAVWLLGTGVLGLFGLRRKLRD